MVLEGPRRMTLLHLTKANRSFHFLPCHSPQLRRSLRKEMVTHTTLEVEQTRRRCHGRQRPHHRARIHRRLRIRPLDLTVYRQRTTRQRWKSLGDPMAGSKRVSKKSWTSLQPIATSLRSGSRRVTVQSREVLWVDDICGHISTCVVYHSLYRCICRLYHVRVITCCRPFRKLCRPEPPFLPSIPHVPLAPERPPTELSNQSMASIVFHP